MAKNDDTRVLKYGVGYHLVATETKGRLVMGIHCQTCGRVSYHPKDIHERFCGHCKVFHEDGPGQIA